MILTGAAFKDLDMLVNFLMHIEMAGSRNNTLVLAADTKLSLWLGERGIIAYDISPGMANATSSQPELVEKHRATLALLRGGLDVLWIDADAVMLIDREAIWKEFYARPEAHAVLQRGSRDTGSTEVCPGMGMYRWGGSGPAASFVAQVLSSMRAGADEAGAFGEAMRSVKPRWIAGGTDMDKDMTQLESKAKLSGGGFTIALLPHSHFPLADQNKGKDLPRWAYAYHESHAKSDAMRGADVLGRVRAQKFYFVAEGYGDFPTVQDFGEWACSVLPQTNPTRVIQVLMMMVMIWGGTRSLPR